MKIIIFFLLFTFTLFSQENSINLTENEKKFIKNHPNITLGVDATWAPYVFVEDGKVVGGYEYEIIEKINAILDTNITIVPGVWSDIVTLAKDEKLYGLSVSIASEERSRIFDFTNPNVLIRNNFIVKEGNPSNIQSLKDLENKIIAIQKDNGFQKSRVKNIKGAHIVEFDDYKNFNLFLRENNVDAIPMSDASLYTLNALKIPFSKILYLEDDEEAEIVFSIHKRYPELRSILNKAMDLISAKEKNSLRQKWLFSPIIYEYKKQKKIVLNTQEEQFLHKKPRIIIGISKESIKQKEDINTLTLEVANDIYDISGLRIDIKIASKEILFEDMKTKKIDGIVTHRELCLKNDNFSCSYTFIHDKQMQYNFALQVEQKELLSMIDKSLYTLYLKSTNQSFLTPEEKRYLYTNNTIRFCIDPFSPPLEELNEGKYIGVAAEILKVLSSSLNVSFELIETKNWSESLEFIKKRKCDIVPLTGKSKDRAKYMNFTDSIFHYALIFVTNNNVTYINNIQSLKNKKIGIRKDYAINEIIREKYPFLKIVPVEDNVEGMQKVQSGEIFALLGSAQSLGNIIQKQYLGELKISGTFEDKSSVFIGVAKDKEILLNIINKALENIPSETKQNIINKWSAFIYEDNLEYVASLKIVLGILCVIFIILFFFIYRQYLLNQYNQNLKKVVEKEKEKNKIQTSKLVHQSKLAQVGEMTNIIAHQWRQPLSAISATTNNLVFKLALDDKIQKEELLEEIELISNYSQHLSSTINDFREFFKSDKELISVDLNMIINNVTEIILPTLKEHNISLEINSLPNSTINIYNNEIQQAILSIIQNAKDAICEQGDTDGKIIITLRKSTQNIEINIFNNGGCIDDAIIEEIFEPNFTTKTKKGGTGIGLYISKMIVESHCGGKLGVKNEEEGVSFMITLPS